MELISKWTNWYTISSISAIIPLCQLLVFGFEEEIVDLIKRRLRTEMSAEERENFIDKIEDIFYFDNLLKIVIILIVTLTLIEIVYCTQLSTNATIKVTGNSSKSD
jgi:ATP-dependent Clp protease ATP-binding subunit ClpA